MPKSSFDYRPSPTQCCDEAETNWRDSSEDYTKIQAPSFPEFEFELQKAIKQLGGAVFPKLNWSAPKDASWMLCGNTLQCTSVSDIFILLKSSDFVAHDLTAPFSLCTNFPVEKLADQNLIFEPVLVLRRWGDFQPDGEFRCFVKNKCLVGISQRIYDAHFATIVLHQSDISRDLCDFFTRVVKDGFRLRDYTFDVYRKPVTESGKGHQIVLIDFNVFGPPTDPLLFNWEELEGIEPDPVTTTIDFRYQMNRSIQPDSMRQYSVPIDFIHMATGSDPSKLVDLAQQCIQKQFEG